MSYLNWRVGMKVVCVDASPSESRGFTMPLTEGRVYTVREIGDLLDNGEISIRLEGIRLPEWDGYWEGAFNPSRFRPVQIRKTDISIFNLLLLNPHVRISEDA